MKKILLLIAAVMVAMTASAQLYLRGAVNNWGATADYQFTETSAGVFELVKTFTLSGEFKVADGTWSKADNYGAGDQAEVSAGVSVAAVNGSNTNFKVSSGKAFAVSKIVFDKNALTLTVYAQEEELVDDFAYFLHGSFASSDWASEALTESNGVWSISDFVVAQDASFGVKRTNNGFQDAWYWTVAGLGTDVSATGTYQLGEEKTATEGGNPSIKAGTYTISFDPATLILTVTASGSSDEGGSDEGGSDEGEGEGGDDPIDTPTGADYYLIGWINNADYGDKADYENLGDYKFVDGSLVATFEADSYVAIKTGDLAKWYFAEAYAAASPVTLVEGKGYAEKMFVPGGVEVTFTLVENGDGSLTLSYTTGGTTTGIEDIDAEDAVVAAYDLLGRPVAADAAGYVILQYASGKAAKVFNY